MALLSRENNIGIEMIPGSDFTDLGAYAKKRFRNTISSEKLRSWLRYEWLYSTIDREIFLGPNDFQVMLRERLPSLKTRLLLRGHWNMIKRLFGRPRRFSANFLLAERERIQNGRQSLHYLQNILSGVPGPAMSEYLDSLLASFPSSTLIPPRLPPGTKVCVQLSTPVCGMFLGVISDCDASAPHYSVLIEQSIFSDSLSQMSCDAIDAFRSPGKQLYRVPDECVYPLPDQPLPQYVSLSTLRQQLREKAQNRSSGDNSYLESSSFINNCPSGYVVASNFPSATSLQTITSCSDEAAGQKSSSLTNFYVPEMVPPGEVPSRYNTEMAGDYLLDSRSYAPMYTSLAKLFRLLEQKQTAVKQLKEMNDTAETQLLQNSATITVQFQHSYATLILHLDKLNQDLKRHMEIVFLHVATMAQQQSMSVDDIVEWRRRCDDEAQEMVARIKLQRHRPNLDDSKVDLVAKLSCLLIHLCNLSDQRSMGQSLVCIDDIIREIRQYLHPSNLRSFESTVENFIGQIIHAVTNSVPSQWNPDYAYGPQPDAQEFYPEDLNCV